MFNSGMMENGIAHSRSWEGHLRVEEGQRIWYQVQGRGPAIVFQNGVGVSTTFWTDLAERLADQGYTTVLWDYRGHGRSDDPADPASLGLETCVGDLRKLLDELDIERACLLGHSMGAQLGWEFYRHHPTRVAGLVPTLGTYRNAVASFFDMPTLSPAVFSAASFMAGAFPRVARRLSSIPARRPVLTDRLIRRLAIVHPTLSPQEWVPPYLDHMARLDPRVFFALARAIRDHDASDLLPEIRVPVLVVAGERDRFCPARVAQEMAEQIPDAEMLLIPDGSHAAIIERPELVERRLLRFLRERVYPAEGEGPLRIS